MTLRPSRFLLPPQSAWTRRLRFSQSALYLAGLWTVMLLLSTAGITHESTVSLHGDMPRYLMNGVYFYDLLRDLPITNLLSYTYQYYARYPALSLGHHPVLLSITTVPLYALCGISVFSARLVIVSCMIMAGTGFFFLLKPLYGANAALLASLLFITSPEIVHLSRVYLAEMQALALIIAATYCFCLYYRSGKKWHIYMFFLFLILSIFSRYTSVFMVPIFAVYFFVLHGINMTSIKKSLVALVIMSLFIAPIVVILIKFAPLNMQWSIESWRDSLALLDKLMYYPRALWKGYLAPPAILLLPVALGMAIYRREKTAFWLIIWIVGIYLQITYVGLKEFRYGIYLIPACCALSAMLLSLVRSRLGKLLVLGPLVLSIGSQFTLAWRTPPEYTEGYEEAARSVVEFEPGESVLFSGKIDTGFFVFFMRKHDPARAWVVLQADKMLVTSHMQWVIAERITTRDQIYELLGNFGTRYVVIEDTEDTASTASTSRALEWLREELKTARFILRKIIPIHSNSYRLHNAALAIYEYREYAAPPRGQTLRMPVPLLRGDIVVPFDALLHRAP